MKIKQVIKVKKGTEEIYNDGNNAISEDKGKNVVRHTEYNRDNEVSLYIKPETKKSLNIDKSSFPSNVHKETGVEIIDGSPYKYSIDGDVELKNNTLKKDPSIANKDIIKSKIDGALDWTNVQDKNLSWDSSKGAGENLGDLGIGLSQQATGTLGNMIGLSNSALSNLSGGFNSFNNDSLTRYDEDASKLNEWKQKKFKEIHVQDWKPGQTLAPGFFDGSLGNLTEGIGNSTIFSQKSRDKFNKTYNTLKEIISPDPVKTIRDAIKPTKGIVEDLESIKVQSDIYSKNWTNDSDLFNGLNKSEKEIRMINALKNKNTFNKILGNIYIRPNYIYNEKNNIDEGGVGTLEIPFEFNPIISEGGTQANYAVENLMNRIGQFHIYTGTNLSTLSIELSYMALAPDVLDDEGKKNISKQFSTDTWQYYWTNNRIEEIEYKLRSLVMPDVVSDDYLIRPPLIEIHLGNPNGEGADSVGDLFKYPIGIYDNANDFNNNNEKKYLATSRTILGNENINRYKKYLVTSVQISNFNDDSFIWPSLYGRVYDGSKSGSPINHIKTASDLNIQNEKEYGFNGYTRRTGFKATLQCTEVTENFLDIVPDFKSYYDAWMFKGNRADEVSKYVKYVMDEKIEDTTDYLSSALNTAVANISNLNDRLEAAFSEAYSFANIYKDLMDENNRLNAFACQSISKENNKNPKMDEYYFANPKWIDKINPKEKSENNAENKNPREYLAKPIYFKISLSSDLENFLNKANLNWESYYDQNFVNDFTIEDNTSIANSKSKLSNINIPFFPNTNDENVNNIFKLTGLLPKDTEHNTITDKLLIFNNDLELKEYTDAECIVLIKVFIDFLKEYHKTIEKYKYNFPNEDDNKKRISEIIINMVLQEEKTIDDDNYIVCDDDLNIVISNTEKIIKDYIDGWDNAPRNSGGLLDTYEAIQNAYKEIPEKEGQEKPQPPTASDISKLIIKGEATKELCDTDNFYLSKKDFETIVFQDLYSKMSKDGINPLKISSIFKNAKTVLFRYYDLITEIKSASIDIINNELMSIKDVMEKVSNSIIFSLLYGKELKIANKCLKHVSNKAKNIKGENIKVFEKDVDCYETKNNNYCLFNIEYILDKILESYKKSIKNLSKLNKEYNKNTENMNSVRNLFDDIENIEFSNIKKINNDCFNKDNENEIIKYFDNFLEKYIKLITDIAHLKEKINFSKTQKLFCEVAGYDEKTISKLKEAEDLKTYIKVDNLKPLDESYEEYSKSPDKIKDIYKNFDKKIKGEDVGIDLNIYSSKEESGKIPNLYFQLDKATEAENSMQVAGSSMKGFSKLSI